MSLLQSQLRLFLTGRLDQAQLDDLYANIGLVPAGSATDPIGTELGRVELHNPRYAVLTEVVVSQG